MRKLLLRIGQLFFLLMHTCVIRGQNFDQMADNIIEKAHE